MLTLILQFLPKISIFIDPAKTSASPIKLDDQTHFSVSNSKTLQPKIFFLDDQTILHFVL